jgi:hypothetical protein
MDLHSTDITVDALRSLATESNLYAIVDSTADPVMTEYIASLEPGRAVSLFEGTEHEPYTAVAPYLLQVGTSDVNLLLAHTKSDWGVFAVSEQPLGAADAHFRELLFADLPDGKRYLFRFYDPRVLPAFVSTCDEDGLIDFFGPMRSFIICRIDASHNVLLSAFEAPRLRRQ